RAILRPGRRPLVLWWRAVEVEMRRIVAGLSLVTLAAVAHGTGTAQPARLEFAHPARGHESPLSAPAVAAGRDGVVLAWITQEQHRNIVYAARPGDPSPAPVRVSPETLSVDGLHQARAIATGPGGEI